MIQTEETAHGVLNREMFELNRREDMDIRLVQIGETMGLIVDNVYKHPEFIRNLALSLDYFIPRGNFPGKFASITIRPEAIRNLINEELGKSQGWVGEFLTYSQDMSFGMVDITAEQLSAAQRQPHFDAFGEYAALVYLNTPDQVCKGTSFWKHKKTGLTKAPMVENERTRELMKESGMSNLDELRSWMMVDGLMDPIDGFLTQSTPYWELTQVLEMKFNRLVVYDANLFHSLHFTADDFGTEKSTRRLTQNIFLTTNS